MPTPPIKEFAMKPCTRILVIAALTLAALGATSQRARAERIGGPMADVGTIQPGQSVYFDIPFRGWTPASVAVMGNGPGNVELYMYDGFGNVAVGGGSFERRTLTVNVQRGGFFRVEVRNTGAVPSNVVFGTN
jgi:hypothetical protein